MQFNHRMLAYTSLAGVVGMWRYGTQLAALPPAARLVLHALAAATAAQVCSGGGWWNGVLAAASAAQVCSGGE